MYKKKRFFSFAILIIKIIRNLNSLFCINILSLNTSKPRKCRVAIAIRHGNFFLPGADGSSEDDCRTNKIHEWPGSG